MQVTAPDGREWDVIRRVRWPRWRHFFDSDDNWWDAVTLIDVPADGGGFVAGLVFSIIAGLLLTALIILLAPLIVFVFEAIVVLIAAIVLGRPWLVVASTAGPPAEDRQW